MSKHWLRTWGRSADERKARELRHELNRKAWVFALSWLRVEKALEDPKEGQK